MIVVHAINRYQPGKRQQGAKLARENQRWMESAGFKVTQMRVLLPQNDSDVTIAEYTFESKEMMDRENARWLEEPECQAFLKKMNAIRVSEAYETHDLFE